MKPKVAVIGLDCAAPQLMFDAWLCDLLKAHREGCEFVRATAMQQVEEPFDIVITSNSGYPLDMNLYQGVKGMAAAARILKPGGLLILAAECSKWCSRLLPAPAC